MTASGIVRMVCAVRSPPQDDLLPPRAWQQVWTLTLHACCPSSPVSDKSKRADDLFLAANLREVTKLRKKHPGATDHDLVFVLRHTRGLMEGASLRRVLETASFVLADRMGRK